MNPPDTGKLVLSILRGQELKMTSDNTGVIKLSAVGPTNIEGAAKMSNLLLLLLVSKFMLYGSDTHDFWYYS